MPATTALTADNIVIGGTGHIFTAPSGTTLPTTIGGLTAATSGSDLDSAFVDLGYTDPSGVSFRNTRAITDIMGWQSFYPLRKVVDTVSQILSFSLMQFDLQTVPVAFGGGAVEAISGGGGFKYVPPGPEEFDELTAVVDIFDGDIKHRIVIDRCIVQGDVETNFTRTAAGMLPIELASLAPTTGTDAWNWISNAPGFGHVSSA